MDTRHPGLTRLVVSSFRLTVALMGIVLFLWIMVGGFLAILTQPYLLAALWLLGMVGLLTCASAYLNTFPGSDQDRDVPHPLKATLCLGIAATMGWALWTQALPAMANEPLGLSVIAAALAGTVLLGGVVAILLSALLLLEDPQEGYATEGMPTEGMVPAPRGMASFSGRETVA
jgi:hypothetical protein